MCLFQFITYSCILCIVILKNKYDGLRLLIMLDSIVGILTGLCIHNNHYEVAMVLLATCYVLPQYIVQRSYNDD